MATLFVDKIDPQSGTSLEIGSSGDTITTATGAKPSFLYPAFRAYTDTIQTTSDGVATKAELDLETYDTDNCYDTSTYRFTPNVAGKYYFNWVAQDNYTGSAATSVQIYIRKNGSDIAESVDNSRSTNNHGTHTVSTTVEMNGSSDYVEFFLFYAGGSSVIWRNNSDRQFAEGFRIGT
jgi:hypothetical protein